MSATTDASALRGDLVAGVSVAALLVPEALAYSGIAGLPPSAGVVALLAGLLIYAALGRSRFAIVSGTSSAAALLAADLAASHAATDRAAFAATLVIAAGLCFGLAALLRLGGLSNLIARPVLRGYGFGLACVITIKQCAHLVQVSTPQSSAPDIVIALLQAHAQWWWPSLASGVTALVLLFVFARVPKLPGALIVAALGIALSPWLSLHGVALVGPSTLMPTFAAPALPAADEWLGTLQLGAALVLVLYAESYSAISAAAIRHGDPVERNRDLFALAVANVASGALRGLPVGAGFTATGANDDAGAQTRRAGLFAALASAVLVVTCAPLIARIPLPVLAAIVIHAVSGAWAPSAFRPYFLWRRDRLLLIAAAIAVLAFGILNGLLIAVALSIVLWLHQVSTPRLSVLGRLRDGHDFVRIDQYPDTHAIPGWLILRPEEPLFFGNAAAMLDVARTRVMDARNIKTVVLSLEASSDLDGTSVEVLGNFATWLSHRGIELRIARARQHIADLLERARLPDLPAEALHYWSVDDAVCGDATNFG
ncbi:SulP family inorganic anion transporter [Solilutibacter silvestris]|uniref:Sulfate permease n=1 Tax=Solilutibacter silvestris TaxID=1645665 RepID=A0A2K1Q2X1_9GAMM|nr:SulP family inorganic anion transporter [Lysobacter silvestris]PNS09331.1 Sulfate permease [Lysobacter silvestris]